MPPASQRLIATTVTISGVKRGLSARYLAPQQRVHTKYFSCRWGFFPRSSCCLCGQIAGIAYVHRSRDGVHRWERVYFEMGRFQNRSMCDDCLRLLIGLKVAANSTYALTRLLLSRMNMLHVRYDVG